MNTSQRNTLIIGGGPAGLAAALMLAKRGWKNITVLEQRPAADYYEPDKSFNYLIDGRGQKLTDILELTQKVAEISVDSKDFYLTEIKPDGSQKRSKLPVVDPNRKTAYWIPRRAFVELIYQEIQQNWQDNITVIFNAKCQEINRTKSSDSEQIEVIVQNDSNKTRFYPDLLVGCDGINSIVRTTLKTWDNSSSSRFEMQSFPSPSTGLRYKVLTLPPQFPLDNRGEKHAIPEMAYAVRSKIKDKKSKISLGLLPLKSPDALRTANIITRPNHAIWDLKTSEEISNFLEASFPQLPINQIISQSEIERFTTSEGGKFPTPQYCSGFYFLLNDSPNSPGIVLLGDAIHCFPPDIGQGVNSALEDVYVLNRTLTETNDDISRTLPMYESLRLPDIKPLIKLAQTAFPWQYNQSSIGKFIWSINFFIRFALSKILPFIFSPPAFIMIQNHNLSYEEIWQKAQNTSRNLYIFGLMIILGLLTALRISNI